VWRGRTGDGGSSTAVETFFGLSPITEAMELNFLEPESLLLCVDDCCLLLRREVRKGKRGKEGAPYEEEDFKRIEERDHHEREGLLGVGIMDREGVCAVQRDTDNE
jgi:hypothetical protein